MPDLSVPASPKPVIPLLSYQREDLIASDRFNWCCWSRQTGKSFTKSLRRLLRGLARRRTQIFLSAGLRQSAELMTKVQQHCHALQIACRTLGGSELDGGSFGRLSIELPNGIRIIGLPANPQTVRGFTGDVLLDEFAMHRDDRAIWAAVFPTILRNGGELDIASTPRGKDNVFAELRDNPHFRHSIVTLDDAIAAGLRVDADEIRRSMNDDELYRQEFGCEFLDESAVFLGRELIARAEDATLSKAFDLAVLGRCRGPLFVGVDIGRVRDLTVMWVLERVGDRLVTRAVRESANEPFTDQFNTLRGLLRLAHVRKCCIDATGMGLPLAEGAIDEFGTTRVEAIRFTAAMKDQLAVALRRTLEEGRLSIPADRSIRDDWTSVRRSLAQSGPARYLAGRGVTGHADRFWAACLAVRAAEGDPPALDFLQAGPLRFSREGIW